MGQDKQVGLEMKYFVLNPREQGLYGAASRRALKEYAESIKNENPVLAEDLQEWLKRIYLDIRGGTTSAASVSPNHGLNCI